MKLTPPLNPDVTIAQDPIYPGLVWHQPVLVCRRWGWQGKPAAYVLVPVSGKSVGSGLRQGNNYNSYYYYLGLRHKHIGGAPQPSPFTAELRAI